MHTVGALLCFIMVGKGLFSHILQGYFIVTSLVNWSKIERYGKMHQMNPQEPMK